jgi:ABC-type branched-subunit amino acid transport system ATPase component
MLDVPRPGHAGYGAIPVLHDILRLEIGEANSVGILGTTAGKTTAAAADRCAAHRQRLGHCPPSRQRAAPHQRAS